MDEEDQVVPYKDISELKKELEGLKGRKDVSSKELYDAVQALSQSISDMLEVFGAAAEQMKQEEKGYDAETKKHEMIISKLDKLIDQNKTIAEGMVSIVELVKEKLVSSKESEETIFRPKEPMFRPNPQPRPMTRPQTNWQPKPEPYPTPQFTPISQPISPSMHVQQPMMPQPPPSPDFGMPDFGMPMPPMEPTPGPDLSFPEEEPFPLDDEPKKKGIFDMFKK